MKKIVLLFFFLLLAPVSVSAHLSGEAVTDNNYRIELGHLPLENIQPGENVSFTASMENLDGVGIMKTTAWIRVSLDDLILFSSTNFVTDDGTIDFSAAFEKSGVYDITVRIVDIEKEEEATGTFSLVVGDPERPVPEAEIKQERKSNFNLAVLTLALGVIAGILLARYRPVKETKNTS